MSGDDNHSPGAGSGQRDFLSRWSQRKVEARQTPEDSPAEAQTEALQEPTASPPADLTTEEMELLSDEALLEHLNLPDPDTLRQGDDFTAFMKKAVPTRLRNRALRKLWLSNPALANVDMLLDYGDDFTDAATVLPGMTTAYEVGKGIVRKIEELADDESEAIDDHPDEVEAPSEAISGDAEIADELTRSADLAEEVDVNRQAEGELQTVDSSVETGSGRKPEVEPESDEAAMPAVAVRRMRFSFES